MTDLWEITLQSGEDVEVQVRTCEVLTHCLRQYRRDKALAARLTLPWRPLYEALRRHCAGEGLPELRGGMLAQARHSALFSLVPRARRHFPASAAAEVWAAARPALVEGWVSEWLDVWERLAFCDFWSSHWMYLLARTAKDDWKGVVDWRPLLPRLYTHMLAAFRVPVGTATSSPPMSVTPPSSVTSLFGHKIDQVGGASRG
ncbi:hypothetical protein MNEG_11631 [Monoraphidium neglectum]|uniref:Uncharacterized protein n=1 Tax=Monoraphidium neglectum TaxID=145388 RepID=A0A0D2MNQ3_9CHLO|nr:hypothetical protein MNEG_11631 [Monoraphidium neglectum]KIY96330.1 hypothetical protein MNEG_11631 [Monoraphidium neglectum]|eukprot:XP_013895350.1 hypothetical protein MNEG_11631 [Monoraphidium neglectum]